jgi:hypothetical protein
VLAATVVFTALLATSVWAEGCPINANIAVNGNKKPQTALKARSARKTQKLDKRLARMVDPTRDVYYPLIPFFQKIRRSATPHACIRTGS